jgi:flagellar basal-body rod protein FlgC
MNLFGILEVSASALVAERQRAEVVASNMANAETTRIPQGGPYRRQLVVFRSRRIAPFPTLLAGLSARAAPGVRVDQVVADPAQPLERYQPGHPDANAKGYVAYPAINPVEEMTDLLGAVRAYELNAAAVQAAKSMIQQSLEILRWEGGTAGRDCQAEQKRQRERSA